MFLFAGPVCPTYEQVSKDIERIGITSTVDKVNSSHSSHFMFPFYPILFSSLHLAQP